MTKTFSHTLYQKGTYLHHELKKSDSKLTSQINTLYSIPVSEDPTERWLEDYPLAEHVSMETALQALNEVKQKHEQGKLRHARNSFVSQVSRLDRELDACRREFISEIEGILGHRPSEIELQEIADSVSSGHPPMKAYEQQRILDSTKSAALPLLPIDPVKQKETEEFYKWAAEERAREAQMPKEPHVLTRAEKDAKERAEYKRYSNLINEEEAKLRNRSS